MSIKSVDLSRAVEEILTTYGENVAEVAEETSKRVANNAVKKLRKAGSFNGGEEFRKGWAVNVTRVRGLSGVYTIYNKTKPGLAHLLEFGHAKANGGRTRAYNFIAPIADTLEEDYRNTFVDVMTKKI